MKSKLTLGLLLFILVSCSSTPVREIASNICDNAIKDFLRHKIKEPISSSIVSLVQKNILVTADLEILKDTKIKKFLSRQKIEREDNELDLILIKKKYPSMDSSQVLSHFKLLRNSCLK